MKLGEKLSEPEDKQNMIRFKVKGNWNKTEKFLEKNSTTKFIVEVLEKYGREGVVALSAATPVDTGLTASSWTYRIEQSADRIELVFENTNKTITNIPIVILLQYGHGNGRGGYVQGRDFINPAIQPIFDKIEEEVWKGVSE